MGFFNKLRSDGETYDGQGDEHLMNWYGSFHTTIFLRAHNS